MRTTLTHTDSDGRARMVDVGAKRVTRRTARAAGTVDLGPTIAGALRRGGGALAKGNVLETARLAGVMAAKRTADLIPMCHPLGLDAVGIVCELDGPRVRIESSVRCCGRTGVEMEALTAVAVAALTVYDMCKSAGKGIVIRDVRLIEKTGGASGRWHASANGGAA